MLYRLMAPTGNNAQVDRDRERGRATPASSGDVRRDPYTGTTTYVVGSRQTRPSHSASTPSSQCPFCPGGLEAPETYTTKWFPNRWPAMPDDRCEVLLYTPEHEATFADIGVPGVRRIVDLWSDRTAALGERSDVDYVLVFENRGAEVGATISHPHCQIYAYDHIPIRPRSMFESGWVPDTSADRSVAETDFWSAYVPHAAAYPVAVTIAPKERRGDLCQLDESERDDLSLAIVDVFSRLDRLFDDVLPTMMWINQRPSNGEFENAWMSIEIVSPWRARGLSRYIAAAEIGGGEYFLPLVPESVASSLRET